MSHSLLLILIGFIVGTFGTLVGAGGGFILMPIFFFLYPTEPVEKLTAISLCIVFFNAFSGSIAYARKKRIDYKSGVIFAIASIPGAILGSLTTRYISRQVFDPIFATLLIIAGLYLFFRNSKNQECSLNNPLKFNTRLGVILSIGIGYISSLLGIGGGIIHVPALVTLLHFPVHIATATSHFVLAVMAFFGTIVHLINGSLNFESFQRILFLAPSVVIGAQVGARLSLRVKGRWIIKALAMAVVSVGVRLLMH